MLGIKYSGAGVPVWTNRYNGPGNGHDIAYAVAVDASGNVLLTGSSTGAEAIMIMITRRLRIRARACRCGPTATKDRETVKTELYNGPKVRELASLKHAGK